MRNAELHVAVAVIEQEGRILISRRHDNAHQGGKWEFPGGKLEAGESVTEALARELDEELGIHPTKLRPLIRVRHQYPQQQVLLDVWKVSAFSGDPEGREGQPIQWIAAGELSRYEFPDANQPIVKAIQLPETIWISKPFDASCSVLERIDSAPPGLMVLRQPQLSEKDYSQFAAQLKKLQPDLFSRVLLTSSAIDVERLGAAGLHISGKALSELSQRPLGGEYHLSASCHNIVELALAAQLDFDMAMISPVLPTATHPDKPALGWDQFRAASEATNLPLYALGGMSQATLADAWQHGAQGISATCHLWHRGVE